MRHLAICLAVIGLIATPATVLAQSSTPAVSVEQPWARASAGPARNGVAYMTLTNSGTAADRLVAAASPVAGHVEFHTHVNDDGVMRMRAVSAIEIAPGEPIVFKPGGLHVMLVDLEAPLRDGESFPLVLTFEKTGAVEVNVAVQKPGAMKPSH